MKRSIDFCLSLLILVPGPVLAETDPQGEWVIPRPNPPQTAPAAPATPAQTPEAPKPLPPSDFEPAGDVESTGAQVLTAYQEVLRRLTVLLENDGDTFNGRITLNALSAMELDSSPATRYLVGLFTEEMGTGSNRRPSLLDVYESGNLRASLLAWVGTSRADFARLLSGASLRTKDFRLRNRVAFLIHFLDKYGAILDRANAQEKVPAFLYQPLRDSVQLSRQALLATVFALQPFSQACQKTGDKGLMHTLWFAQAGNAAKGPAQIGAYRRAAKGEIQYLDYGQAVATDLKP